MTHKEILSKIDWEVKKQERFLNLVGRANRMKPKDREAVLKNACWVDGTVEGQVQYCLRKREKLLKAYRKLYDKWINIKRPFKYSIFDDKTKKMICETNIKPLLHQLQTWEETDDPNIGVLKQTKTVYVDNRYEAKLRLFNYIRYTKNGLEIPKYEPYKNTEIGKTVPILNF